MLARERRRGGVSRVALLWPAFGLLAIAPGGVAAQSLVGRALEDISSEPVPNALVRILDARGGQVGSVVTSSSGVFRWDTQRTGLFTIRIETLFHEVATADSILIRSGETTVVPDIRMTLVPILLDPILAQVERIGAVRGSEWVRRNQLLGRGTILPGAVIAAEARWSVGAYVAEKSGLRVDYDRRGLTTLRGFAGCLNVLVNRWPLGNTLWESIDEIPRERIAAVEVYPSYGALPPGYYFDGPVTGFGEPPPACGIINIWLWNSW